ncbi:MAG TPA: nicotinate-nucleotide--dimethylbenzimidazole phosphoribosyltransferase [Intrasporangiaceae bacterium]|nr:nicotinate-nucleotide--dimethylbenzimidazole phosphoribosyltransferase [Intrasporangiaceae bacterium]
MRAAHSQGNNPWWEQPCRIPAPDHAQAARSRQTELTKPPGSLGALEDLAVTLAGLQHTDHPRAQQVPVLVFAADHGVTAQGISAFPAEVTVQMLANFASGGAAIAVLARELDLPLHVWDVGTCSPEPVPGVTTARTRLGTDDFSLTAAMSGADLDHALSVGAGAVRDLAGDGASRGADLIILGDMGIGNTTAASALTCALTALPPELLTGRGTGLDEPGVRRKQAVIEAALDRHRDAIDAAATPAHEALRRVGGLELAALAGAMIAAAQHGIPVLVDGFVVSAAALAAVRLNPGVRDWLVFTHCSAERGHRALLEVLEARPLLDLGMRLGEASGAAVALPLVRLACALHSGMATFAEAAVATAGDGP